MKNTKYANGYMPKIEYWLDKVENGRTKSGRAHAREKVMYFIQRQLEVYGNPNVIAGVDFTETLSKFPTL